MTAHHYYVQQYKTTIQTHFKGIHKNSTESSVDHCFHQITAYSQYQ